jgi:hypothetical protein
VDGSVHLTLPWPFFLHFGEARRTSLFALVFMTTAYPLAIPFGLIERPGLALNLPVVELLGVTGRLPLTMFATFFGKG